jgi:hypothetical protein
VSKSTNYATGQKTAADRDVHATISEFARVGRVMANAGDFLAQARDIFRLLLVGHAADSEIDSRLRTVPFLQLLRLVDDLHQVKLRASLGAWFRQRAACCPAADGRRLLGHGLSVVCDFAYLFERLDRRGVNFPGFRIA